MMAVDGSVEVCVCVEGACVWVTVGLCVSVSVCVWGGGCVCVCVGVEACVWVCVFASLCLCVSVFCQQAVLVVGCCCFCDVLEAFHGMEPSCLDQARPFGEHATYKHTLQSSARCSHSSKIHAICSVTLCKPLSFSACRKLVA